MNKIIKTDEKYLSNVMKVLPSNVLLNKGITGCGGTHTELISKRNSIILVPGIELAKNKSGKGILTVYHKTKDKEILNYINSKTPYKKIIGTYDCLPRLISQIPNIFTDYFLLLDEYHLFFNAYVFRNYAIYYVLKNFRKFNNWCFMTATPTNEEFILSELQDVPIIEVR